MYNDPVIITATSTFAAGLAVLCIAYDNWGTNGADSFTGSVTDTRGNTWTARRNVLRDPLGQEQGIVLRIFTTPQNGGLIQNGDSISINIDAIVDQGTHSAWTLYQVSRGSTVPSYVTGGTTSGASTSGTITSGTISLGNVIIGATGIEQDDAVTADSDTTNGSWANTQTALDNVGGANASSIRISTQSKIVTAAATQTYNTSWATSTDYAMAWIEIG